MTEAEKLIPSALDALEREDKIELTRITARVFYLLNNAKQIEGHPYLKYKVYDRFEDYESNVTFCEYERQLC